MRNSQNCYFYHIFVSPWDAPGAITLYVVCMEREFHAYKLSLSMYPCIFNSFPDIRTTSAKKTPFSRTAAHMFVSPGDAPATITQYAAWMERQFNACQTPRSMYLSIFNSFRVIWCLSQCISPKTQFLPHFCFPWGPPWGNHAKCCMDKKWTRCLQIVSLHVPIYLLPFLRYSEIFVKKSSFYHTPLAFDAPVRGFPSEYRHPLWDGKTRMVSLSDSKKFRRYLNSFWRDPRTWRTDRRTDTAWQQRLRLHRIAR